MEVLQDSQKGTYYSNLCLPKKKLNNNKIRKMNICVGFYILVNLLANFLESILIYLAIFFSKQLGLLQIQLGLNWFFSQGWIQSSLTHQRAKNCSYFRRPEPALTIVITFTPTSDTLQFFTASAPHQELWATLGRKKRGTSVRYSLCFGSFTWGSMEISGRGAMLLRP